jgi:hypothetical protein
VTSLCDAQSWNVVAFLHDGVHVVPSPPASFVTTTTSFPESAGFTESPTQPTSATIAKKRSLPECMAESVADVR